MHHDALKTSKLHEFFTAKRFLPAALGSRGHRCGPGRAASFLLNYCNDPMSILYADDVHYIKVQGINCMPN